MEYELIFFRHCFSLFRHSRFATDFLLNEDGRIRENRLRKLHYRFRRNTSLINGVKRESQYLQSFDGLLQNLA